MMDVKEDNAPQAGKFQAELRLYLEVIGAPGEVPPADAEAPDEEGWPQMRAGEILLFFKFYDAAAEKIAFVGTHVAKASHTLTDLLPVLRATKGLPADQQLAVYEEVEYDASVRFEVISESRTLKEAELQSGDIIVFQTLPLPAAPPPPADAADADEPAAPLTTIPQFFEHVKNRVVVNLHKLAPQQQHAQGVREKERAIQVTMDKRMTYDQVTAKVGRALGVDPLCVRLTMHNPYSDLPKPMPVKYRGYDTLLEMLTSFQKTSDTLFYETLSIPLPEYEAKKSLKVSWHNSASEEIKVVNLLLNKNSTVADALAALSKEVPPPAAGGDGDAGAAAAAAAGSSADGAGEGSGRKLRLMEVVNHRIYKIFGEHEEIELINDQYWTIRAEEVAAEELRGGADDKLIHVRHFYREQRMNMTHNFGDPFLLTIGADESTASVRARIQAKLGVTADEIAKWKFAVVSFGRVEYLEDDEIVRTRFRKQDGQGYANWDDYLGLEHAQVQGGRKKAAIKSHYDKPIKING